MSLLPPDDINSIIEALIHSGLDTTTSRPALMQFIQPAYVSILPRLGSPVAQLVSDLGQMNSHERLANGDIPLAAYLRNASLLLTGTEQQKVIRTQLDAVNRRASGAPKIDVPKVVAETPEKIVHTDDLVTFAFMQRGVQAATAVMKLRVPRFEAGLARTTAGGTPVIYLGTGWLLTGSLLITNHHVINARNEGELDAIATDLALQAKGTVVQFDFDGDGLAGTELQVEALEAWSQPLDYAIVRIPATTRQPLVRSLKPIVLGTESVPVNIIQHPGGRSKRYGIRNNLLNAVSATELRYFTDTESGSSGSPVLNDQWQVVGLHRASAFAAAVQFQGKPTAYVNVGTPWPAIAADLQARFPALAATLAPDIA
jgi:hypothetical protein